MLNFGYLEKRWKKVNYRIVKNDAGHLRLEFRKWFGWHVFLRLIKDSVHLSSAEGNDGFYNVTKDVLLQDFKDFLAKKYIGGREVIEEGEV